MIKLFLCVAFATALIGSAALAQQSATEFTPGQTSSSKRKRSTRRGTNSPKNVTYVTSDGRVIEVSKIRKDSTVHVHYIKGGADMLVDRVTVTDARD
jgi:hypothetical protein